MKIFCGVAVVATILACNALVGLGFEVNLKENPQATDREQLDQWRKTEAELYEALVPGMSDFFHEMFQDDEWAERWIVSVQKEYEGIWKVGKSPLSYHLPGEKGLLVKSVAKKHAIARMFPDGPFAPKDKDFVVQYEVRFNDMLECGGAYIKLISKPEDDGSLMAKNFGANSPYTIMFGPDRCGTTNKVHFILRHKSPKSGNITEHHAESVPAVPLNKWTHLYSLVVRSNNTYEIYVDGKLEISGDLLSTLSPPINPPKTIDDPTDSKPADWVDDEKIPDPSAVKPDDWQVGVPEHIPVKSAEKPEGWVDEEGIPERIPDPAAVKPKEWITEEDGEWEPPTIRNPKCRVGCGKWEPPMMANPEYQHEWTAPLIDNPAFKGKWQARQIPNPDHFEDLHPHNVMPMIGVGIELWTMQKDIEFDNIYVGFNVEEALRYGKEAWKLKFDKEHFELGREDFAKKREKRRSGIMGMVSDYIDVFTAFVIKNPMAAFATGMALLAGLVYFMFRSSPTDVPSLRDATRPEHVPSPEELQQLRERIEKSRQDFAKLKEDENGADEDEEEEAEPTGEERPENPSDGINEKPDEGEN